jgi:hypothetical protein
MYKDTVRGSAESELDGGLSSNAEAQAPDFNALSLLSEKTSVGNAQASGKGNLPADLPPVAFKKDCESRLAQ